VGLLRKFQPNPCTSTLLALFILASCTTVRESFESSPSKREAARTSAYLERSQTLVAEGKYDEAYKENQKILSEGKAAPDVALFNMGVVSAHPSNPRKNYPAALASFKTLLKDHPQSTLTDQAKLWIQVIEEQQRVVAERQRIAEERQKLIEEKRTLIRERELLTRERESLSQEREKLKYTVEKTRQVDIEVEKRRRQALTK